MVSWQRVVFALFGVGVSAGCQADDGPIDDSQRELLMTLGPLEDPPPSPSNSVADDPVAGEFGAMLFADEEMASMPMACMTCHLPAEGWSDDVALSTTAGGGDTPRHSQTLTNVGYQEFAFWNGKSDSLWGQAFKAWNAVHGLEESHAEIVDYLLTQPEYVAAYTELFTDPEDALPESGDMATAEQLEQIMVNCAKAVEAFERLLVSRDSPLDRWIAGDTDALSETQKRGAALFVGEGGCISCHSGPNLSDGWFHNIGLAPGLDGVTADEGLALVLADSAFNSAGPYSDDPAWGAQRIEELAQRVAAEGDALVGAHKTPTLRDVTLRKRLGHNGDVTTLRDWIVRYRDAAVDEGAVGELDPEYRPRNLSDADIDDLVVFMDALLGDPSSADLEF